MLGMVLHSLVVSGLPSDDWVGMYHQAWDFGVLYKIYCNFDLRSDSAGDYLFSLPFFCSLQ